MKILHLVIVVGTLSLLCWHCAWDGPSFLGPKVSGGANQNTGIGGVYLYSGYDAEGRQIVKGVITIEVEDTSHVTGTWNLQKSGVDSLGRYGPQVGSGNLVGHFEGDKIGLNLNPDYIDNNVLLAGTIYYWGISGAWNYIGFPGVLNQGTFRAVRSK